MNELTKFDIGTIFIVVCTIVIIVFTIVFTINQDTTEYTAKEVVSVSKTLVCDFDLFNLEEVKNSKVNFLFLDEYLEEIRLTSEFYLEDVTEEELKELTDYFDEENESHNSDNKIEYYVENNILYITGVITAKEFIESEGTTYEFGDYIMIEDIYDAFDLNEEQISEYCELITN